MFDLAAVGHVSETAAPWVDVPDGQRRLLHCDPVNATWALATRYEPGSGKERHHHTGPVFGFTLSGRWYYEEYGEMYEAGRHVKKDVAKAAELYEKGCERGGCLRLGRLYEAGALDFKGGDKKKDPDAALRVYRRECEAVPGWEACQAQGLLLEKRDATQARAFYAARCTSSVAIGWACDGLKRAAAVVPYDVKPGDPPPRTCLTPLACPKPAPPATPKAPPKKK